MNIDIDKIIKNINNKKESEEEKKEKRKLYMKEYMQRKKDENNKICVCNICGGKFKACKKTIHAKIQKHIIALLAIENMRLNSVIDNKKLIS